MTPVAASVRVAPFSDALYLVNATVTAAENDGWVAGTSTLNFNAGVDVANTTFVRTGSPPDICVYSTSDTHLIIDVQGLDSTKAPAPAARARWRSTSSDLFEV